MKPGELVMFQPRWICLVKGAAEGRTALNAFDNALLKAGIGDVNLVKVSSIVPPGVAVADQLPTLPRGAFVPCVYTARDSDMPGETIAVALALGLAADGFGVIMETKGESEGDAAQRAQAMVQEAFEVRGLQLQRMVVMACEHKVQKLGCVIAACIYW